MKVGTKQNFASTETGTVLNYAVGHLPRRKAGVGAYLILLGAMFIGGQIVTSFFDLVIYAHRFIDLAQGYCVLALIALGIATLISGVPIIHAIRTRLADGRPVAIQFASLGLVLVFDWWALMFCLSSAMIHFGLE